MLKAVAFDEFSLVCPYIQNRARLKMLDINERKNAGAVFVFHAL